MALPVRSRYRKDVGLFQEITVRLTLFDDRAHLDAATRWNGGPPDELNAIVFDDCLRCTPHEKSKTNEFRFVDGLVEEDFDKDWDYKTLEGKPFSQPIGDNGAFIESPNSSPGQAHEALTAVARC